jgi:hypothetical protein
MIKGDQEKRAAGVNPEQNHDEIKNLVHFI